MGKEKIELTIPTNWEDITIGMYQQYIELKKKKLEEDEEIIELVCVLCSV